MAVLDKVTDFLLFLGKLLIVGLVGEYVQLMMKIVFKKCDYVLVLLKRINTDDKCSKCKIHLLF